MAMGMGDGRVRPRRVDPVERAPRHAWTVCLAPVFERTDAEKVEKGCGDRRGTTFAPVRVQVIHLGPGSGQFWSPSKGPYRGSAGLVLTLPVPRRRSCSQTPSKSSQAESTHRDPRRTRAR